MLRLVRTVSTNEGTFGVLIRNERPLCLTCEDPWRGNSRNISCIPEGDYQCVKRVSQKYKSHWHVLDVPNRSLILIHQGNTIKDTEGCILVGNHFSTLHGLPSVASSMNTLNMLRSTLPDNFTLSIRNAF